MSAHCNGKNRSVAASRQGHRWIAALTAAVTLIGSGSISAESVPSAVREVMTCSGETQRVGTDPSGLTASDRARRLEPPASPTVIEIALYVTAIKKINVIDDEATFSAYAEFSWCDPRNAFDPAQAGIDQKRYLGDSALAQFRGMWQPDLRVANGVDSVRVTKRVLTIQPDGTVKLEGIFSADISVDYDLRKFPIDRQTIPIQVESFTWSTEHMVFRERSDRIGFEESISIPEWRIEGIDSRVTSVSQVRDERPFSRFTVDLYLERESDFYLYKVAFPLFLIVALSWSVFWMRDENFAGRTRVSSTGVLTIVAYQFAIGNTLPRVPYLTLMDQLMITSFLLIAVTVAENLLVSRYSESNPALSHRIDRIARWLFPVVYCSIISIVMIADV
jgi:hypothetical protein